MIISVEQGSQQWLDLRKTKITATDASVILGVNPWVFPEMLMARKKGIIEPEEVNQAMLRGQRLEPIARKLYEQRAGFNVTPTVRIGDGPYDWAMCSTDGEGEIPSSSPKKICIEIKSGIKAFDMACKGHIPDYYLAQVQHILWITGFECCHYCAFDGEENLKVISVIRNEKFIQEMVEKEYEFYKRMIDECYVP